MKQLDQTGFLWFSLSEGGPLAFTGLCQFQCVQIAVGCDQLSAPDYSHCPHRHGNQTDNAGFLS